MTRTVVEVDRLSKKFRKGTRLPYYLIGETVRQFAMMTWRMLREWRTKPHPATLPVVTPSANITAAEQPPVDDGLAANEFWAIKDLSFDVREGDVLGIIGRNGAGKSTLLKILSMITEPSAGEVRIRGRVGSLLEVGTGFHPELTGRENVFLNGAILGMTRAEVQKHFDEIVEFAEIASFLDTPVKHYSSGMYMRLGFAVAAHLDPEILIVDEVLAVGDAHFQKKCLGKMSAVATSGRTVLFVSHSSGAIASLCNRVLWLSSGQPAKQGNVGEMLSEYQASLSEETARAWHSKDGAFQLHRVVLKNSRGEPTREFPPGDAIAVEIHAAFTQPVEKPAFWVGVRANSGSVCIASMLFDGCSPGQMQGEFVLRCHLHSVPLIPGQTYSIVLGVDVEDGSRRFFGTEEVCAFRMGGNARDAGLLGAKADFFFADSIPTILPYTWEFPDGERRVVPGLLKSNSIAESRTVT